MLVLMDFEQATEKLFFIWFNTTRTYTFAHVNNLTR